MVAASTSRQSGAKKTSTKRQAAAATAHLVSKDETWGYIASRHNMSVDKLRALNPDVADLKVGARVRIK